MAVQPTGAVTFLFTDIEGSTRLWEEQPDVMQRVMERHDELLRQQLESHEGYVFTTAGDAFSAAFSDPRDALSAALDAQHALAAEDWEVGSIRVRMGLHSGVAHERDGDYFGPTLNRAARIMAAGHGGQVLVSQSTKDLLSGRLGPGTELRSLGEHRLKDLGSPEHLHQVHHPGLHAEFPGLRTLNAHLNNLPVELTSFVGRHDELEETVKRLRDSRLLTLTGVGGSGKTRLALQTAAEIFDQFPDGVWVAEMAGLADAGGFARWVAEEMGIARTSAGLTGGGGEQTPEELIQEYLAPRTALLVLDNCEHLISAAARFVDTLLKRCPHLKILTTSREGLGIRGEYLIQVPSLTLPTDWNVDDGGYPDAMELFAERASAVNSRFELNEETAPAVARICERLDGMPLAIELAAARARMLTPEQIAERLSDSFRLLTGGSRTALPRQQTLLATVDWSYQLLNDQEKLVFDRLAVFRGGFFLEAAEAIIAGDGVDGFEVFEVLASLIDKSMVQGGSESGRFTLLETLRQFALQKLTDVGRAEAWRERHAAYYVQVGEEAQAATRDRRQVEWFDRLERDHENIKAALTWSIENDRFEDAARICRGVEWLWFNHNHRELALDYIDAVFRGGGDLPVALRADLHAARARFLFFERSDDSALADADRAVELARQLEDPVRLGWALIIKAGLPQREGEVERSRELLAEAFDAAQRGGSDFVMGHVALWQAWGYRMRADVENADRYLDLSKRHFRASGVTAGLAFALTTQGIVRRYVNAFDDSVRLHEEAIVLDRQTGNRAGVAFNLGLMSISLLQSGRVEQAVVRIREGVALYRDLGTVEAEILSVLSQTEREAGNLREAFAALLEAVPLTASTATSSVPVMAEEVADLSVAVGALTHVAILEAYAMGERDRVARPVPPQFQPQRDRTRGVIVDHFPDWEQIKAAWAEKTRDDVQPLLSVALGEIADRL